MNFRVKTIVAIVSSFAWVPGFGSARLTGFAIESAPLSQPAPIVSAPLTAYDYIFINGFENPCIEDSDRDGLSDCVETNTRRYVSPSDTGTDPHNPDTDGDGISDGDEVLGTIKGLNLPAMGVNPLHKDILLEYDWFNDSNGCASHSHRPTSAIAQQIHDFFAASSVANPDGSTGINVIQDYGQGGLFTGGNLIIDPGNTAAFIVGTIDEPQYQSYEANNFAANRKGYFHYVLLPHQFDYDGNGLNYSGVANIAGSQMMVTLGCDGAFASGPVEASADVRNTIVHELGHNLGLLHGGDEICNNKINYSSIMNYSYQFRGIDARCNGEGTLTENYQLGFSHGLRLLLDEKNINEHAGMCISPHRPYDFNSDGRYDVGLMDDLNPYGLGQEGTEITECGAILTVLHDFDDWGHLRLSAVSPALSQQAAKSGLKNAGPFCAPIPHQ